MTYDTRRKLNKIIAKLFLTLVFTIFIVFIPMLWSDNLASFFTGLKYPTQNFGPGRSSITLNSSALVFIVLLYLGFFLLTLIVSKIITSIKMFSSIPFALFLSSLLIFHSWFWFEGRVFSEYFIFVFGNLQPVLLKLELLIIFTGVLYISVVGYSIFKFFNKGILSDYTYDIYYIVNKTKEKFNL